MDKTYLDGRVTVKVGDITLENVDAIVNAANRTLLGGGGVDGAIHDAGGPRILEECEMIRKNQYPNGLPTGKAVITIGGNLVARHVIHTVGPIYGRNGGRDADLLGDCYRNSIALATESVLSSIAFPSISTGAFGYPKHLAAAVASAAIAAALNKAPGIRNVSIVFFSLPDAQLFVKHCSF
jgi:O-acetyl-ADP-ribose deacetylase (regulator of RNase III)